MMSSIMKITRTITAGLSSLAIGLTMLCASCGAPDPAVQKQMDTDIMSAGKKKGPGETSGPQYMQGSQGYGLGGY